MSETRIAPLVPPVPQVEKQPQIKPDHPTTDQETTSIQQKPKTNESKTTGPTQNPGYNQKGEKITPPPPSQVDKTA